MEINFNDNRHLRYKKYWDIFRNEPSFKKPNEKYVPVALGMEIVKLYRDLGFSKGIAASVKNDNDVNIALDRLIYENDFNSLLSEAGLTVGVKGDVVLKNYLDEGKSKISFIQPEYYFPELDPRNQRKIVKETIAFPVEEDDETFLYSEIYEKRNGEYWCISKKNYFTDNDIGAEVMSEHSEVNTQLLESPLTHVPFSRNDGSLFGYSVLFGIEPLLEEYNWRCSQISIIMDKFTSPNIIASANILDDNYQFKMSDGGIMIPMEEGEVKPEYMTWDSQLQANFEYIDQIIMKAIHFLSPLNSNLYGLTKESANSSALSIKLKAFRTSQIIENSLTYWQTAIKKVLLLAQQLDVIAGNGNYNPQLPNVELSASMPEDSYTQSQEEQLKVVAGVTSIKSSIARLNPHYSKQEIDDEFLEIINEENERQRLSFMENEVNYDVVDTDTVGE
ncbi:phage portal protein [Salipaludibacillus sp. HK11]|uniref:phage portal protein n=1 Tax=Salipaludibacillus sp. HK11 TaxID=3394320 RepID=UPI0039FCD525